MFPSKSFQHTHLLPARSLRASSDDASDAESSALGITLTPHAAVTAQNTYTMFGPDPAPDRGDPEPSDYELGTEVKRFIPRMSTELDCMPSLAAVYTQS